MKKECGTCEHFVKFGNSEFSFGKCIVIKQRPYWLNEPVMPILLPSYGALCKEWVQNANKKPL